MKTNLNTEYTYIIYIYLHGRWQLQLLSVINLSLTFLKHSGGSVKRYDSCYISLLHIFVLDLTLSCVRRSRDRMVFGFITAYAHNCLCWQTLSHNVVLYRVHLTISGIRIHDHNLVISIIRCVKIAYRYRNKIFKIEYTSPWVGL
jgi:hypothetical protein